MAVKKPKKKTDYELFELIEKSIRNGDYVFLPHARKRIGERRILEPVILAILEDKTGRKRKRNKAKDSYKTGNIDWNYCIEGVDPNNQKIRIILSFTKELMPIITVMWIGRE